MKPFVHAKNSALKYGGDPEDYIEIHNWMDSSKVFCADNRHRAIWHHSGGIFYIEKIFGINYEGIKDLKEKYNLPEEFEKDMVNFLKESRERGECIKNSSGKKVSVRDIAEQHVAEDYGMKFIPSAQDFLQDMEYRDWMQNGQGFPPSYGKIIKGQKTEKKTIISFKTLNSD